jgi:hypothetical protein
MALRRKRTVALLVVVVLTGLAVVAYQRPRPLSPAEQEIVGRWWYPTQGNAKAVIIHFQADRSCRVTAVDNATREEVGTPILGHWYVADGKLVCDWRSRWEALVPAHVAARDPWFRWSRPHGDRILAVTEEAIVLGNDEVTAFSYKRYAE